MVTTRTNAASSGTLLMRTTRLNGLSSTGIWSTIATPDTVSFSYPVDALIFEPDIAINAAGTIAWVVYTVSEGLGETWVRRIPLTGGGSATDISLGYRSLLPPRIAYHSDNDAAVILGLRAVNLTEEEWRISTVGSSGTTKTHFFPSSSIVGLEEDMDRFSPATDFDFDCQMTTGTDVCVITAVLREAETGPPAVELPWSRTFTLSSTNIYNLPTNWVQGAFRVNAVVGVATSPTALFVASGRGVYGATDTTNTRLVLPGRSVDRFMLPRGARCTSSGTAWRRAC